MLVLALYVNSENVKFMYSRPEFIWLLCPLVLYIISRIWMLARRGELHEDPVVFMIGDRRSQWLSALGILFIVVGRVTAASCTYWMNRNDDSISGEQTHPHAL